MPNMEGGNMSNGIKIALILAVTAIIITGMRFYFSPYQSCVRAGWNEFQCVKAEGG